ncbi:olfactory receptor 1E16-like [Pelodiscus sinensis]|uniref:olfactory receptor 1E16-like n=1 Tax=Pelodiscus sinensis TaxID=13735 RepID=UPI003F6C57A7
MGEEEERNQTFILEFILLGFGEAPEMQPLLFLILLVIYLMTLVGNTLIVALVVTEQQLHTPMYYLLWSLACLETCFSSAILPRLLASLQTGDRAISVKGCFVQSYFFGVMSATETLLLTAMSYDRYLAICHPLRYTALMNGSICIQLAAWSWISSFLACAIVDIFFFQLKFCHGKEIDHFFCDFTAMLKLSCDDTQFLQLVAFTVAVIWTLVPMLLTLVSYVCIIISILRISSTTGRLKAFSTCSSHLIVLTVYYVITICVYLVPIINTATVHKKIFSFICTVLPPMVNPVIYCLRNKEVKASLRKAFLKLVDFSNTHRIRKDAF